MLNKFNKFRAGPLLAKVLKDKPDLNFSGYKFLHKDDLKYWLKDKTIKIDSLSSFSQQECIGGVGDPLEMEIRDICTFIKNVHDPKYQLTVNNLDALGLAYLNTGFEMSFSNCKVKRKNRFVYCMSKTLNKKLYQKWQRTEGYDSVIKIHNIVSFLKAIHLSDYQGNRVLGGTGIFDWVEYVKMPPDLSVVDLTSYKFIKDIDLFKWQDEARISWPEGPKNNNEPYFLYIPNLLEHVEIIDIPDSWNIK